MLSGQILCLYAVIAFVLSPLIIAPALARIEHGTSFRDFWNT